MRALTLVQLNDHLTSFLCPAALLVPHIVVIFTTLRHVPTLTPYCISDQLLFCLPLLPGPPQP